MRSLIRVFIVTLILASISYAGQRNIDTEQVAKNIITGLTHENEGVVESAIRVVILMKIAYPEADYSDIIDELEDLIMDGANKNIRLKALIATDYLNNFDQYGWLKNKDYSEGEQVFDEYLNKMNLNRVADTR